MYKVILLHYVGYDVLLKNVSLFDLELLHELWLMGVQAYHLPEQNHTVLFRDLQAIGLENLI